MLEFRQYFILFLLTFLLNLSSCNEEHFTILDSNYQFWTGGTTRKGSKQRNSGTYYTIKIAINSNIKTDIDSLVIMNKKTKHSLSVQNKVVTTFSQGDTLTITGTSFEQIRTTDKLNARIYYTTSSSTDFIKIRDIQKGESLNYQ